MDDRVRRFSLEALRAADERLALCTRTSHARMLALGEALQRIWESGKYQVLGFSTFDMYVQQRVQRDRKSARELAILARRLRSLPLLRAAVERGEIAMSAAHALARSVTPDDEAGWVELARQSTVRAIRTALKEKKGPDPARDFDDDEDPIRPLRRTMAYEDKVVLEAARMRMDRVAGHEVSDDFFIEMVCAEVETTLQNMVPPDAFLVSGFDADRHALAMIAREEHAAERLAAETRAEGSLPRAPSVEVPATPPLPEDIVELDRFVVNVCAVAAGTDLEIGRNARVVLADLGWKRLGYGSPQQYARERAGLSLKTLRERQALAHAADTKPSIAEAIAARRVGLTTATVVAHASKTDADAAKWLDRSDHRTVKHLQEEVRAARLLEIHTPPDDDQLEVFFDLQRKVESWVDPSPGRQMSAEPLAAVATSTMTFKTTESIHDRWCRLEHVYRNMGEPYGPFVRFAAHCFWRGWLIEQGTTEYADVHIRDRCTCTSPVCNCRNVNPHHIELRSRGGGEERTNLTSPCFPCHPPLIHDVGSLRVTGLAPYELTWLIGPPPARFVVRGRELVRKPALH